MPVRSVVLTLALLTLGSGSPAIADDHRPPMAFLRMGTLARGKLVELEWTAGSGRRCRVIDRQREFRFPQADHVEYGLHSGRLRFITPHRPRGVRILAWFAAEERRRPIGPPEELEYELHALRKKDRTVAWEAVFGLTVVNNRYLAVRARWPDRDGCSGTQKALWTFHVRPA